MLEEDNSIRSGYFNIKHMRCGYSQVILLWAIFGLVQTETSSGFFKKDLFFHHLLTYREQVQNCIKDAIEKVVIENHWKLPGHT